MNFGKLLDLITKSTTRGRTFTSNKRIIFVTLAAWYSWKTWITARLAKGMFGKHMLDSEAVASLRASAVFGQFRTIVKYVCWKRLGHSGMETACADDLPGADESQSRQVCNPLSAVEGEKPGNPRSNFWKPAANRRLCRRRMSLTNSDDGGLQSLVKGV